MNIPTKYDDEYEQKMNTDPLLLPAPEEPQFIPYIDPYSKLGMQGFWISITEGVFLPTAYLFQLLKPRIELTPTELTHYLRELPREQRYSTGMMRRVGLK